MKKLMMIATLLTIGLSAQAKRGDENLTFKNSMAGFTSESIEESVRLLYRTSPALKNLVSGASVQIATASDSRVVIELSNGSEVVYNCLRFDDWSNGGTVLKKEVVCRQ